jgi:hypothetical protein
MAVQTNSRLGVLARFILVAGGAGAVALAGGCTSAKAPAAAPRQVRVSSGGSAVGRPSGTAKPRRAPRSDAAAAALPAEDECAARLHDISGLLLLYFVANKHLPEKLEDLAPLADPGTDFQTTCPVSGRPYVYVPGGLPGSGSGRVLIVYDAVPAHNGIRWGIAASPPQGDQPLATWVMPFSEERFRRHMSGTGG